MTSLLSVESLHAGYGEVPVLEGVSLHVEAREMVAVVGANGAGKTTLMNTIAGILRPSAGRILLDGEDIGAAPAHSLVGKGLALVPEGGKLFPFMTVEENLELGSFGRPLRRDMHSRLAEVMELFPILAERRRQLAGKLSGGERQMCAIARAIMSAPKLLLLDEPSVGLSPLMVGRVFELVETLARRKGLTVVLVEQNVAEALQLADRAYVLDHGRIVRSGPAAELADDPQIRATFMGIAGG